MLRFRSKSAYAAIAAAAIGLSGCSGLHSLVPSSSQGLQPAFEHTRVHFNSRGGPGIAALKSQPPVGMQMAFLMTDGTVLTQSYAGNTWYKYAPDSSGSYSNGTWTQVASLPSGYDPSAFASAVQDDGRLVITGGEYNSPGGYDLQLTNLGAVYDPTANTWTSIGHPKKWNWIGDSPSMVLADGSYFMGQKLTKRDAELNYKTMQWKTVSDKGKADWNAEEGYNLLPDGTVLSVDVKNAPNSELYNPKTGTWKSAGSTIVDLHSPSPFHSCLTYGPKPKDCYLPPGEIGPAMLRPDGTVFATGSGSGGSGYGVGHTSIYHTTGSGAGTWTVGPDFPNGDNAGDSFAVLLPSGNVLVFGVSGEMYEFDGSKWTSDGGAAGPPLLLPTGQVMMLGYTSVVLFTPKGSYKSSWAPTISSAPSTVTRGSTYQISGTQFNGLSQADAFGDEYQNATNYPLVRITNTSTGHVFFARTHGHSSMGVATGSATVSTNFDVPSGMETGASTLVVVANGIPSKSVNVTVQ